MVELGELKRCVVTIDVHPGLRGRVCKVDGDVVVKSKDAHTRVTLTVPCASSSNSIVSMQPDEITHSLP